MKTAGWVRTSFVPARGAYGLGASGRSTGEGLLEKPAGAAAQTTKINTVALRVKRKRGREWAGGHSPSGGGAASGPSWLTAGSDGVVRPVMATLGPAYCSRGQQQQ